MKQRIFDFINHNRYFIHFIYALIVLNVALLILASYQEVYERFARFFDLFEIFSVVVFSIEYLLRVWTADLDPQFHGGPIRKRLGFTFSLMGLVDLFAILPFYLPLLIPFDLRVVRILRLLRLVRIFKLGRYSKSMQTISSVLRETRSDLGLTLFVAFILMVLASTMMYYLESEVQPENFASIGHAFWWAVATLTTVGYGDVYPLTALGKALSGVIAILGIGIVALPTGIISSAFIKKIHKRKTCTCPKCGTEIEV